MNSDVQRLTIRLLIHTVLMPGRWRLILLPLLLAWIQTSTSSVKAQLPGFQHGTILSGIYGPTSMVFLPDGRMLVSLLSGSMLITEPWDQPPVDWGVYLEMTNVDGSGEHGVIELMLDPDFVSNGHFYVYYSANTAQGARNRLSRFTHLGDSSSMSTEVVLWEDPEPYVNCCHTGGAMTFMDDGTILLAVGDDFRPATAQDMSSGFGKVHRIHADGSVPMDNPFWDATPGPFNANGVLKTIYCSGLRNPFRGSLDPVTGLFLIGEVGGNNHAVAWEDLHAALPGANFGWPSCGDNGRDPDGGCSDPQFVDPVFAYSHAGTGASITGGITYTGSQFPSAWQGRFLYGDYARGWIDFLELAPDGSVLDQGAFLDTTALGGVPATSIVKLVQGPDGSLFYVSIFNDLINYTGSIHRVSFSPDLAPICGSVVADPPLGPGPDLFVQLSAMATDPEGEPLTFVWNTGDGSAPLQGQDVGHLYQGVGNYTAQVQVSDGVNQVVCPAVTIVVGTPPQVDIVSPSDGSSFTAGSVVTFSGIASDDGPLPLANYAWTVVFNHDDHIHPETGATGTDEFDLIVPAGGHGFSGNTWYTVTLTVTDLDGLSSSASIEVFPEKVDVFVDSEPSGLEIVLDGMPQVTPFVTDQAVGSQLLFAVATSEQCQGGDGYVFDSWSDGQPLFMQYLVPAQDDTVKALFSPNGGCSYCGRALAFDGVLDRLELSQEVVLANDLTLEFWLKPSSSPGGMHELLRGPDGPVVRLQGGRLRLDRDSTLLYGTQTLVPNQWSHVAVTRTNSDWRIFINGQEDQPALEVPDVLPLRIDAVAPDGASAGGAWSLDELRFWSVARSVTELEADLSLLVDPSFPGLLAYWRFDDPPSQQSLPDLVGGQIVATKGADAMSGPDDPLSFSTSGPLQWSCARPLALELKVFLQGAYMSSSCTMRDDLRLGGYLPLTEPYSGLGFDLAGSAGATLVPSVLQAGGQDAIVDWVLVELRAPSDPSTVLRTVPALLQRDGDIVSLSGNGPLQLVVDRPAGHLAVRHRNHLGAMTAAPIFLHSSLVQVDLSDPGTLCYGTEARVEVQGVLLLRTGNTNLDNTLKYIGQDNDRDPVLQGIGGAVPTQVDHGYRSEDVNMDGTVKYVGASNDRDMILRSIGGSDPSQVLIEQLPTP